MRNKLYFVLSLSLLALINPIFAQQNDSTVHKTVTVTREFQPVINDAGKIITSPKIVEADVVKTTPDYSDITTPLRVEHNVHLLKANELMHTPALVKNGFARVGFGNSINTLADFSYPIISNDHNLLDASLNHLGAFQDKVHSKTNASVRYNHLFNKLDLYAAVGGRHDYFNYYGRNFMGQTPVILSDMANSYGDLMYYTPTNDIISLYNISGMPTNERHWRFQTEAGVRSLPNVDDTFQFDVAVHYNLFSSVLNQLNENTIKLKGNIVVPFNNNSLGMLVDIVNFNYQGTSNSSFDFPDSYSVLNLNPYLSLQGMSWHLRLGLKMALSLGHGTIFTPAPDVVAEWFAIPDYLALYGGVTGGLKLNSLSDSYLENRYLAPQVRINDSYTPLDAYLGIKLSPVHNLLFDVYGAYKVIQNQYFFVNRTYELNGSAPALSDIDFKNFFHNRFDVVYSVAERASLGGRASWEYRDILQVYAKAAYHHWNVKSEQRAWHMPKWDADMGVKVNFLQDFSVSTQFIFQDGMYAKLEQANGIKLPAVSDLNLTVNYVYNDWVAFFLKGNNLLNNKYQLLNGYSVQGINGMLGAAFSF